MNEVGIYRVSGSASDLQKLKKSFESSKQMFWNFCRSNDYFIPKYFFLDAYEAEQLLKEVDIHSVTGILKSYLRELPEALFTDQHYQKVSIKSQIWLFFSSLIIYLNSFSIHLINSQMRMRRRELRHYIKSFSNFRSQIDQR